MVINYFGLTSFRLQETGVSLLFNPAPSSSGLVLPRMQNDIIVFSQAPLELPKKDNSFIISTPGEYEVKGIFIYGLEQNGQAGSLQLGEAGKQNIIYLLEFEGVRLVHLGLPKPQASLSAKQLERLEGVDILMVPIGGNGSLSAKQAAEVINELEPRMVIPMNYQLSGLKLKLDSLEAFKKEIGGHFETVDKIKVSRKELPEEETKFVVIEPSR